MTLLNTIAAPLRSPAGLLVLEPVRHSHWPRYLLTPGIHRIGTGADNELAIPAVGLAPGHALIRVEGSRVILQALDRRTWVNDGPVRECVLRADDRLAIGPCLWTLRPATADDLLVDVVDSADSPEETARAADPTGIAAPLRVTLTDSPAFAPVSDPSPSPKPIPSPDPIPLIESADQLLSDALRITADSAMAPASASPPPSRPLSPLALQRLHDELQALRRELDDARTRWRDETAVREIELATEAAALARRGAALEQAGHDLERSRLELLRTQTEIEATRTQQSERTAELHRLESRLRDYEQELIQERQRLEQVVEQTRSQLTAEADQQTEAARQWEATRQRLLEDLVTRQQELEDQRRLLLEDHQTLAADRDELLQARTAFEQAAQAFEAERLEWQDRKANWEERTASTVVEQSTRQRQLDAQQQELHALREQLAEQQSSLETARAQLADEDRELQALAGDATSERSALVTERSALDTERQVLAAEREILERQQKQLATSQRELETAQQALTAAQEQWTERQRLLEQGLASASAAQLLQQEELQRQRLELAESRQDLEQEQADLQAARVQLEAAQGLLTEDRAQLEQEQQQYAAEITASREQLDARRQELARQQQEFALEQEQLQALRERLEADQAGWQQATALLETRHDAVSVQEQNQQAQLEQETRERARWQAELQATQESLRQDRRLFAEQQTAWRQERDSLWQDLSERRQRLERETLKAQDAHRRASELEQALALEQASLQESQTELVRQQQAAVAERDEKIHTATDQQQRWFDQVRQLELLLESALVSSSSALVASSSATELSPELTEFGDFSTAALPEELTATLADERIVDPPDETLPSGLAAAEPEHTAPDQGWSDLEATLPAWRELPEPEGGEESTENSFDADGHLIDLPVASAAESAESSLRAELARMFNLPESFASSPGQVEEHDSPSDRRDSARIHGFSNAESLAGDESAESPDADAWKTRLNELLTGAAAAEEPGRTPELTAEFVPDHGEAAEVPSGLDSALATSAPGDSASATDESEDDDSIARYMERLLARQRKPSGATTEAEPEQTAPSHTRLPRPEPLDPVPPVPRPDFVEPAEPRKRVDKSTTRAELQSMREVANLSARAALARHSWRTTRTELGIQTALAGLCTLGVIGYGSAPLWGRGIQWFPLLGCLTGALFIGFRTWQTLCKLRQWTTSIEAASSARAEESGDVTDAEEAVTEPTGE